jgi:hypothetical protein
MVSAILLIPSAFNEREARQDKGKIKLEKKRYMAGIKARL